MTDEHPRMTTREVCALARYSSSTLWKRIDAGHMPKPLDRGGDGFLFDRKAVLIALGMEPAADTLPPAKSNWDFDADAYRRDHPPRKRGPQAAGCA